MFFNRASRLIAIGGEKHLPAPLLGVIPHAPAAAVDAKIISAMGGISQIAQHQVVVLNRGAKDGLEAGHVLAIFQRGKVVKDPIGSDVAYQRQEDERARLERESPTGPGRMWESIINDVRGLDRAARDFVCRPSSFATRRSNQAGCSSIASAGRASIHTLPAICGERLATTAVQIGRAHV